MTETTFGELLDAARALPLRTEPLPLDTMPRYCISRLPGDESPILIVLGESGYYPLRRHSGGFWLLAGETPESWNAARGITACHAEAMQMGSMFGWDVPGADPTTWAEHQEKLGAAQ